MKLVIRSEYVEVKDASKKIFFRKRFIEISLILLCGVDVDDDEGTFWFVMYMMFSPFTSRSSSYGYVKGLRFVLGVDVSFIEQYALIFSSCSFDDDVVDTSVEGCCCFFCCWGGGVACLIGLAYVRVIRCWFGLGIFDEGIAERNTFDNVDNEELYLICVIMVCICWLEEIIWCFWMNGVNVSLK